MSPQPSYVLGHTDRERRRLALQAAVLNPLTDSFLRRVGISAGMRVLELGCGIGEVTLMAARLVGPHGSLLSLDIDDAAMAIARARVDSAGHRNVAFQNADVLAFQSGQLFDAVVGRHILIHMPDPLAVLRKAVDLVHPGGVIAFQEFDLATVVRGFPAMPLMFRTQDLIHEFFTRALPHANMGAQLPLLMQQAGLPPPEVRSECCVDGGPHSPFYEWITETLHSVLPRIESLGIMTAAELDIDTLEARLRAEALETRGYAVIQPMVGAFARKP
jgi:ubiquinone/menaquinone biosynthesis C-methylase UbiE